jgi:hypothetical protein
MWPQTRQAWLKRIQATYEGFLGSDEYVAHDALLEYPPLSDGTGAPHTFGTWAAYIAQRAAERSREIARDSLSQYQGYFGSYREFRSWLHNRTYREALRLVLEPARVEAELNQLPAEQRRLLQWLYIDQLTDLEVARVRAADGDLVGGEAVAAARHDCMQAYHALETRLRAIFPGDDVETIFPLFL